MVLLTMTPSIVEALALLRDSGDAKDDLPSDDTSQSNPTEVDEPDTKDPAVGNPISHGQILDTWKELKAKGHENYTLEGLLRGANIYVPPPPPKPEPTQEYKELMARLRREEEERSYERMLRKAPQRETFAERFPMAPMAHSFAEANKPFKESDVGEDDLEFGDVQKQITLIINFLVSVFGCGIALWKLAKWWPVTSRLLLSLGGAILVAITEVTVYSAYTWRMSQGEKKQKKLKEVKEVVNTWVVNEEQDVPLTKLESETGDFETFLRRRLVK